jgi:hypothetical protein
MNALDFHKSCQSTGDVAANAASLFTFPIEYSHNITTLKFYYQLNCYILSRRYVTHYKHELTCMF